MLDKINITKKFDMSITKVKSQKSKVKSKGAYFGYSGFHTNLKKNVTNNQQDLKYLI